MTSDNDEFRGRAEELGWLRARLVQARRGSGCLVLLAGPAGIGKTRLVEELVAGATAVRVGWGAATDDPGMPALWPWGRALRAFPASRAALAALSAGVVETESAAHVDLAAATFTADTAVLDALASDAASAGGLVLVLDDLQWADDATMRLVGRLAAEIRRMSVLTIGIHRDPEAPALSRLLSGARSELIPLGPLAPADARMLLSAHGARLDAASAEDAVRWSGGSPLYLRTFARVASAQVGRAVPYRAAAHAPELRQLVNSALRQCPSATAEAVRAASALGLRPDPGVLAALLGVESAQAAVVLLRPAEAAGLVEVHRESEARDGSVDETVAFAHALVRETVYGTLTPERRTALHARAADLLERAAGGRDDRAGAIARHWERSGRLDRAASWALRGADVARAAGAYAEASRYVALAIRASADAANGLDQAALLLDLARMHYLAGELQAAMDAADHASALGLRTGRPDVAARAALVVQGVGDRALNARLAGLAERALAAETGSGAVPSPSLRARVEAQLACALFELGDAGEADRWSASALRHADASGDPDAELDAVRARATVTWMPGSDRELLDLGQRALTLAEGTGRPLVELWAHVWRSDAALHLGDTATFANELSRMRTLLDRTGLPVVRWHWLRRTASAAALHGDFPTCRRNAAAAREIAREWADESVTGTDRAMMTTLALLSGDAADRPAAFDVDRAEVEAQPLVAQGVHAASWLLAGRHEEAVTLYRRLLPRLRSIQGSDLSALGMLGELALALGDAEGCALAREMVDRWFASSRIVGAGTVWFWGSRERWRGEFGVVCGDPVGAVADLRAGLETDDAIGARPYVVRGRLALARALLATGGAPEATRLARSAAAEARRLDMVGSIQLAAALVAEADVAARQANPLSTREREVAELVAQGLSNREVASSLFLSERTVETHVSHALVKLGLRSRTDLTRWLMAGPKG